MTERKEKKGGGNRGEWNEEKEGGKRPTNEEKKGKRERKNGASFYSTFFPLRFLCIFFFLVIFFFFIELVLFLFCFLLSVVIYLIITHTTVLLSLIFLLLNDFFLNFRSFAFYSFYIRLGFLLYSSSYTLPPLSSSLNYSCINLSFIPKHNSSLHFCSSTIFLPCACLVFRHRLCFSASLHVSCHRFCLLSSSLWSSVLV